MDCDCGWSAHSALRREWAPLRTRGGPQKGGSGRGAESAPALHVEERHVDERTTRWTAARHLSTTARNRIPLRNGDSSAWIRTRDLTIMSRARADNRGEARQHERT